LDTNVMIASASRLEMNVEKDGYYCYEFGLGWVWLLILSEY